MKENIVVDALVILDGENGGFFSYMNHEQAQQIQLTGGLANQECINLRETEERKIPESLKRGEACITDILVRLEPNVEYSLN